MVTAEQLPEPVAATPKIQYPHCTQTFELQQEFVVQLKTKHPHAEHHHRHRLLEILRWGGSWSCIHGGASRWARAGW